MCAGTWGFKSPLPHHRKRKGIKGIVKTVLFFGFGHFADNRRFHGRNLPEKLGRVDLLTPRGKPAIIFGELGFRLFRLINEGKKLIDNLSFIKVRSSFLPR